VQLSAQIGRVWEEKVRIWRLPMPIRPISVSGTALDGLENRPQAVFHCGAGSLGAGWEIYAHKSNHPGCNLSSLS
jgi:hypothetical protein